MNGNLLTRAGRDALFAGLPKGGPLTRKQFVGNFIRSGGPKPKGNPELVSFLQCARQRRVRPKDAVALWQKFSSDQTVERGGINR